MSLMDEFKKIIHPYDDEDDDYDFDDTTVYEVTCKCGEVIDFDEETLEHGSLTCPNCGEVLEFSTEDVGE